METISFETADAGQLEADLYAGGDHAVVLAHGKVFDKASWADQAVALQADGFTVIAPNFRGYGASTGPETPKGFAQDIAAAIGAARSRGAGNVSIVGASMGGVAAAEAVIAGLATDIRTLILMAPRKISAPDRLSAGHIAFMVSRDEDCADDVTGFHATAPEPKSLTLYEGDAHAQFLFKSQHAGAVMDQIRTVLTSD